MIRARIRKGGRRKGTPVNLCAILVTWGQYFQGQTRLNLKDVAIFGEMIDLHLLRFSARTDKHFIGLEMLFLQRAIRFDLKSMGSLGSIGQQRSTE